MCALLQLKLQLTEEKDLPIRGRSLQLLGHISVSIGGENFAPYVNMGMESAQQNIALGNDDLREYSYIYYANVAKAMKASFAPALPTLLPHLLEVANESEYIFNGGSDDEEEADGAQGGDPAQEAEENEEEIDDDDIAINGMAGYVITKKSAITALGCIAQYTEEHFGPYLPQVFEVFLSEEGPLASYHDEIRGEAYEAMQHFVTALCATQGHKQGPPAGVVITIPEGMAPVVMKALRTSIEEISQGGDKSVVAKCYESIGGILTRIGAAALTLADSQGIQVGQLLLQQISNTLTQKLPCQNQEPEEDEEGDGGEDHDNEIMDDVTDLIGVLAKVLGPGFIPHFDLLLPNLLKFAKGDRVHSDRSMAVGCFGEVLAEIGPESIKYSAVVLPLIAASVADEMEGVRRNAAFCLCSLIDSAGAALSSNYLQILQMLYPICTRNADAKAIDTGADVDNALSAVAKMIKHAPDSIPLDSVLPVMIASLPLRNDMSEGPSVYGSLVQLIATQNAAAMQHLHQIVAILAQELSPKSKATEETKAIIVTGLRTALNDPAVAPALTAVFSAIQNPTHAMALQTALSSS